MKVLYLEKTGTKNRGKFVEIQEKRLAKQDEELILKIPLFLNDGQTHRKAGTEIDMQTEDRSRT